jgi:two-component system, OmpR family, phosphate regulon sensor histidine kinase PhoR
LADIVDKILLAAQLEGRDFPLAIDALDAEAVAAEALEVVRPLAPERTLTLDAPHPLPRVLADPTRLRQVLVNLLENAVKYSPERGDVEVRIEARDDRLRFLVRDEGIGVPPDEQRRIFDKFVRLDADLTGGVTGTGLGLHIARGFVTAMGGTVSVSSAPGRGSTFVVDLPAAAPSASRHG